MVARLLSIEYPLDVNVTFLQFSIGLARLLILYERRRQQIFGCYYHVNIVENTCLAQPLKGIYANLGKYL